jgi:hypothetical protein
MIEIDSGMRAAVSPSLEHWTGPTAFGPPSREWNAGKRICHVGNGGPYGDFEVTRARCGWFVLASYNVFMAVGTTYPGDSGSPVIDYNTGTALGLISSGNYVAGDWGGPAMNYIVEDLKAHGYDLTLATAPYNPPAPRPEGLILDPVMSEAGGLPGGTPSTPSSSEEDSGGAVEDALGWTCDDAACAGLPLYPWLAVAADQPEDPVVSNEHASSEQTAAPVVPPDDPFAALLSTWQDDG